VGSTGVLSLSYVSWDLNVTLWTRIFVFLLSCCLVVLVSYMFYSFNPSSPEEGEALPSNLPVFFSFSGLSLSGAFAQSVFQGLQVLLLLFNSAEDPPLSHTHRERERGTSFCHIVFVLLNHPSSQNHHDQPHHNTQPSSQSTGPTP
jgi:Ca2+/Na+ antiporter